MGNSVIKHKSAVCAATAARVTDSTYLHAPSPGFQSCRKSPGWGRNPGMVADACDPSYQGVLAKISHLRSFLQTSTV